MNIQKEVDFDLKKLNTLKISSMAKCVYFPKNIEEMLYLLNNLCDYYVFGAGSNTLFSSLGFDLPLICTKNFNEISIDGNFIQVNSGVSVQKLSKVALENSLSGLEFLIGIPASIGGAVIMNAGCHGQSIQDCIISVDVFDKIEKKQTTLNKDDLNYSYRNSFLKKNIDRFVVLGAKFELKPVPFGAIKQKMDENIDFRKKVQPSLALPNLGSTFQNTVINGEKISAGLLIDKCNLKGFVLGGAKVWENHANFIINYNNCTSLEYTNLLFKMYDSVKQEFNIELEPEIIFVGKMSEEEEVKWKTMLKN